MRLNNALVVSTFFLMLAAGSLRAQDQLVGTWSLDTAAGFKPHEPYFTTCVFGNKLYLLGGMNDPEYMYGESQAEFFDPVTNTWTQVPDMPNPQGWSTSSAIGSKIYDIGSAGPYAMVQIYDSNSNQWSEGPSLPTPRCGLSSCVLDGKIYAIGGANDSSALSTVEIFDTSSNTWSEGTPMPTPRYNLTSAVLNGKIYVMGGTSPKGNSDTVEIFNPETNDWTVGPSLPTVAQNSFTASVLDGMIYTLEDGNLYIFDLSINAWKVGTSFSNVPIYNSNVIDNKLYAVLATDIDFPPFKPNMLIFTPSFPAGVSQPEPSSSGLKVFPTPATFSLQILPGPSGTARLFDLLGRQVLQTKDDGSGAGLDVSHLEAGTYFLRMGTQAAKVVIAR